MLLKNISVLIGGSVAAQIVTFIALPVLSRLYDPDSFGLLAAVMSIVGVGGVIAHGRYHLAIPAAKTDDEAQSLFTLAVTLSLFLGPLVAGLIAIFVGVQSVLSSPFVFLCVVAIMTTLVSLIDVFAYRRARLKRFKKSAQVVFIRPLATVCIQVLASSLKGFGLIAGAIFGAVLSLIVSLHDFLQSRQMRFIRPQRNSIFLVARKYSSYPFLSVPQGMLAAVSKNGMPLMIFKFAGAGWAGQYWLAFRLLLAPVVIFSNAYRQSVLHDLAMQDFDTAKRSVLNHSFILFAISALIVIFLFSFSPRLVPFILGEGWSSAGDIARWLGIAVAADITKIPSICFLQSRNILKSTLKAESSVFVARYGAVIPILIYGDVITAVAAYSIIGLIFWFVFCWYTLLFSSEKD